MARKKNRSPVNKRPLIDTRNKSSIILVLPREENHDEQLEEIKRLIASVEGIKKTYYSNDAALTRIQSRSLKEITEAKIRQLLMENG